MLSGIFVSYPAQTLRRYSEVRGNVFLRRSPDDFRLSGLQFCISFGGGFGENIYLLSLFMNKKPFGSKTTDFFANL